MPTDHSGYAGTSDHENLPAEKLQPYLGQQGQCPKKVPAGYFAILQWPSGRKGGFIDKTSYTGFGLKKKQVVMLIPQHELRCTVSCIGNHGDREYEFKGVFNYKVINPETFVYVGGENDITRIGSKVHKHFADNIESRLNAFFSSLKEGKDPLKINLDEIGENLVNLDRVRFRDPNTKKWRKETQERLVDYFKNHFGVRILKFTPVSLSDPQQLREAHAGAHAAKIRGAASESIGDDEGARVVAFVNKLRTVFPKASDDKLIELVIAFRTAQAVEEVKPKVLSISMGGESRVAHAPMIDQSTLSSLMEEASALPPTALIEPPTIEITPERGRRIISAPQPRRME